VTEYDYNPVTWISLASLAGLSLVSLGQPGLKSGLDEQVYTGGLTAVQQILGGEIGGDTTRFVGGSDKHKTGRFLVKGSSSELVGQFLLISPLHIPVAPPLIDYYEHLVTFFAEETLKTDLVEKAEKMYAAFGVSEVVDFFLESIKKARKKVSIPTNDKLFSDALVESLRQSLDDPEYSSTLVMISELKGKYQDVVSKVQSDRNKLLNDFMTDFLHYLASEHPHSIVMYSKTGSIVKELNKFVNNKIREFKPPDMLDEIIRRFEETELQPFLEEFSLDAVSKEGLHYRIEEEIFQKYVREFPLVFLAAPEIPSFTEKITNFTTRINEVYDVGGTLSRIASQMIQDEHLEELVIPYIRHFCQEFAAGLTDTAWKYMQMVFKLIENETKVNLTDVLVSVKDDIPPSHFDTLEKMITRYKITKIAPLSFTVKKASDVLPFYRALMSSLAFGVNTVISEIAFDENNPNNLLATIANNLEVLAREIHQSFAFFSIFSYLENISERASFTFALPDQPELSPKIADYSISLEDFNQALIEKNMKSIKEEEQLVQSKISSFKSEFNEEIKNILRYLKAKPQEISKGHKIGMSRKHSLQFTIPLLKDVNSIINKTLEEFTKIIDQLIDDLSKAKSSAKQFLDGKMKESDLNKVLNNHGFISKAEGNFRKAMERCESSIRKKYGNSSSIVEKQVKSVSKDISKQYNQAGNFLNINRKNLSKPQDNLIKDSTKVINQIMNSVSQSFGKNDFFSLTNVGHYYLYGKNRSLPNKLHSDISRALVERKNYPMLKEAIGKLTPTSTIFKSYARVLEAQADNLLSTVFSSSGKLIGKNIFKREPAIILAELDNIWVPTLEMGYLKTERATKALKSLLGSRITIEVEKSPDQTIHRVFAVIPSFKADYSAIKDLWTAKKLTLRNTIITLSWFSLLAENAFYMNLLRFSSELYSTRVQKRLEKVFEQIGRGIR
jgi:hypothetical protein